MKGYGQFCPVAKASEILAERWTPLILRELLFGSSRFNDIHRGVPLMSRALLSRRLRRLVDQGVIERRTSGAHRGPEYHLTEAGAELGPILEQIGVWGARWVRSRLETEDLDAAVLMWDIRRNAQPARFPQSRVVVAFRFLDGPRSRRFWWMISDGGKVDLCAVDPGFEADLAVVTDLRTLTSIWLGDCRLAAACDTGHVELQGPAMLREHFEEWLGLSAFARVGPAIHRG